VLPGIGMPRSQLCIVDLNQQLNFLAKRTSLVERVAEAVA
jgi:hypothetical protein